MTMNLFPLNKISGYECYDNYYVSDCGSIWSNKKKDTLIKLKPVIIKNNLAVWLYTKHKRKKCVMVANLVGKAFIPNITNSYKIRFISENRNDCSVSNLTWSTVKRIREKRIKKSSEPKEIEKNIIVFDDEIVEKFKQLYEAVKLKGYSVPTSTEFITKFLNDAMEDYINRFGLRKIIYQMNNN